MQVFIKKINTIFDIFALVEFILINLKNAAPFWDKRFFCNATAREKVVGWYHTGPKLHHNDIAINEMIRKYCPNSVSSFCFNILFCL